MPLVHPDRERGVGAPTIADLWSVFVRRWRWILWSVVLCIAVAALYVAVKTPVYRASIAFRVGQVAGTGAFEPADVLASRLVSQYGEYVADGVKRERPFLQRALSSKTIANLVEVTAEAYSPEQAVAFLEKVCAEVVNAHRKTYDESRDLLKERLQRIETQRESLQQQYAETSALMEQLKEKDPVQASLVALERGRLSVAIVALDAEKPAFAQKLTQPQTEPTQLLSEVAEPTKPAAPRKGLLLVLGAALGLLAGLALALVAEFF